MKERKNFEVKPARLYKENENVKEINVGDTVLAEICSYYDGLAKANVYGRDAQISVQDYNIYLESCAKAERELISHIGRKILARVTSVESTILLERNSVVEETTSFLEERIGETVEATVERIVQYGAFVDIGNGIVSLLHISEVSKSRYYDLNNIFQRGDVIKVRLLAMDPDRRMFKISRKQAYNENPQEIHDGMFAKIICSKDLANETGLYVEYDPANQGIMDIPENMSADEFKEGTKVIAQIKRQGPKGFHCNFFSFV